MIRLSRERRDRTFESKESRRTPTNETTMKHTISLTILTISLALCAAHLGVAQNKSTGDHATATYQSQNNKPGTSDSVQAVNAAGSGSQDTGSFVCDPKAAEADIPTLTAEAFFYKASKSA